MAERHHHQLAQPPLRLMLHLWLGLLREAKGADRTTNHRQNQQPGVRPVLETAWLTLVDQRGAAETYHHRRGVHQTAARSEIAAAYSRWDQIGHPIQLGVAGGT